MELVRCGEDYFNYDDQEEVKLKGIDNLLCVKDKSFLKAGGTFYSAEF